MIECLTDINEFSLVIVLESVNSAFLYSLKSYQQNNCPKFNLFNRRKRGGVKNSPCVNHMGHIVNTITEDYFLKGLNKFWNILSVLFLMGVYLNSKTYRHSRIRKRSTWNWQIVTCFALNTTKQYCENNELVINEGKTVQLNYIIKGKLKKYCQN